jgi:lipoprotein-anchoring transpeptidase ErfK/SrfK
LAAVGESKTRSDTIRGKREQAFQPGYEMGNRLTPAQATVAMRCWGPSVATMLVAMSVLMPPTADAAPKQASRAANSEAAAPRNAGEPIMAIVSIKTQQVTLYDADGWILRAPVSTGTRGRETPAGVFALVEKKADHRSNMYDDAHMPHMQRITWNGIALHGGPLPGYAASHGCVRMPFGFAEKLFDKTRLGMRVIISPIDAAPVEFSHATLFVPKAEAVAAAPARAETLLREAAETAKAAVEAKKAAARAPREAASLTASLRRLERLKTRADAELASADKALAAAKTDEARAQAEERKQKAADKAADMGKQFDAARIDTKAKLDAIAGAKDAARAAGVRKADTARAASEAKLALVPVQVYISRATQKLYVRRATHKPWPDGGEVFDATIEVPVKIRDPDKPIGTHVFTAMARSDAGLRWTAVTIDNGDDAKGALDRITFPQDVLDRIAPTALPRSSIIVSDEPLSGETNYRTEFVAVLSNHPQGGFVTRRPTPVVPIEGDNTWAGYGWGNNGWGSFFQHDPAAQPARRGRAAGQNNSWEQQRW